MKKTIETEINAFLEEFDIVKLLDIIEDIMPLCDLYSINEKDDWVKDLIGDDHRHIRILRTVYLLSRIAERHGGKMATMRMKHPRLFEKMEKAEAK